MTAITSFTLKSTTTNPNAPFSLGHAFKQGDVPSGAQLIAGISDFQFTPKNAWPDGSLKFAILAGRTALTANTPLTVNLSTGTPTGGTALTTANLKATGITASITAVTYGTVSWATTDWDAPFMQWVSGPSMSSWIYRKPIGSDPHLVGWLEVRLFAGGEVEILPWVENGYLLVANPGERNDTYSFSINGTQRFSAIIDLTNHQRTPLVSGTTMSYWLGTDPQVIPTPDKPYLKSTQMVPNYANVTPSASTLSSLVASFTPLQQGNYANGMGQPGYHPSIGLLPQWDALYLMSNDARVLPGMIFNHYGAGRFGIHHRDETTNRPFKLSSYPNLVASGGGAGQGLVHTGSSSTNSYTPDPSGTAPAAWAITHHPSIGYLPYLVTGRFYFLEELQFAASTNGLMQDDTLRQQGNGVFRSDSGVNTTRGMGWALRTLAQAACATPDGDTLATEYINSVAANVTFNYNKYVAQANNPQGFVKPYSDYTAPQRMAINITAGQNPVYMPYSYTTDGYYVGYHLMVNGESHLITAYTGATQMATLDVPFSFSATGAQAEVYTDTIYYEATWMQDFVTASTGFMIDIATGITSSVKTKLAAFFAWKAQSVVGRFGSGAAGTYNYQDASPYNIAVAPSNDANWDTGTGPWYPDWGALYADTMSVISPPNTGAGLRGGNFPDMTSYWANTQPALAYAVQNNITGAQTGYNRMANATNYSSLSASFGTAPEWAITPRTATGTATVTHAVGPAIRFGRMRAGRITISKYHGNGIPASAIPATGTNGPALLYNDIDTVNDPVGTVYRLEMPNPSPASGTFTLNEDSSFSLVGAANGSYTSTESVYKNGTLAYTSPFSATVGATDSVAPSLQGSVSVSNVTSTSFKATWLAATDNIGVTGYEVSLDGVNYIDNANVLFTTFNGLAPGRSYTPRVRAYDAAGNRSNAITGTATTPATVPGVPTSVSAVAGNGIATVSFGVPPTDGGSPIVSYTVTASTGQFATGASSPITVTVPNNAAVTFTVHATNALGSGTESVPSSSVTPTSPTGVPAAPTNVIATAGNGSASVSFSAPVSNGGSVITGYTVTASTGQFATGASSPITVTVPNNVQVTFTVHATNAVGNSTESTPSNAVTPVIPLLVPNAPTNVLATSGVNSVTISFTPPSSDGGAAIIGYAVTASTGQTATGVSSPITITMPAGVAAVFTVHATNSVGKGPESTPSNSATPYLAPDTVKPVMTGLPIATNITYQGATISWPEATDDRGVVAYGYSVNNGAYTTVFGTSVNLSSLLSSTIYTINVRAYDAANNASDPVTVVIQTLLAPIQQTGTITVTANHPRAVFVDVVGFAPDPGHAFAPYGKPIAVQDPDAVLDYVFDWSIYLAATGSTIIANEFFTDVGITDQYDYNSTQTVGWLRGGSSGQVATLTNKITTDDGRVDERSVYIKFKDQ